MNFPNPFKKHDSDAPTAVVSGQVHSSALVEANMGPDGQNVYAELDDKRASERAAESSVKALGNVAASTETDVIAPVSVNTLPESADLQSPVDPNQQKAA